MMFFIIITISLMSMFYISYIAKSVIQKKQGITTNQLGKNKTGFVKFIEVSLKTFSYLIILVQVLSIIFYKESLHISFRIIGLILNCIGVLVFIISIIQMKDNWRAGVDKDAKTSLVTNGIYSISRNPAFLGFDLMYLGILLSFFNWYLFVATVITAILFHLQITCVEEDFLLETFKDEYINYKKKVCRYIGRKIK